jgi:hypothetical protein
MRTYKLSLLLIAFFVSLPFCANADDHTDKLSKCLVDATTPSDQVVFMRWMFATLALHPAVASMARISDKEREDANKLTAALVTRLMTEDCRSEVRDVALFDGPQAIGSSFEVFGRSAMLGLMTNEKVTAGLQEFSKLVDEKKLQGVISNAPPTNSSSTH